MASLPLEATASTRLRAQAQALFRRGMELCRAGEELKAEALELRTDADRLEREPVAVQHVAAPARSRVRAAADDDAAHDLWVADRVFRVLTQRDGMSATDIADHVGISPLRTRAALRRLEAAGVVRRTGQTRATRYYVQPEEATDDAPAAAPGPDAVTLRVFTKTMPERELEDRRVAYSTEAPVPAGALPEADTEP